MKYEDKFTLEDMIQLKKLHHLSCEKIAKETNLSLPTVQKIFGGITKTPRYETFRTLERYFMVLESKSSSLNQGNFVKESGSYGNNSAARKKFWHTVEEYELLPEEQRVELIDGVFYDMASPTILHQMLGMEIGYQLNSYIKKNKGNCIALLAPMDVQLDCDNYTILQPDVLVVCDAQKYQNRKRIFGAPDLAIEIISESTRKNDFGIKANKYIEAGVREYWIVDAYNEKIYVYDIEHGPLIQIYTFEDDVPVLIYGGACKISFSSIKESLALVMS